MNKKQLTVIWVIATYFAFLGTSLALKSYAYKFRLSAQEIIYIQERRPDDKSLQKSAEQALKDPLVQHGIAIQQLPHQLLIGLPFIVILGAVSIYTSTRQRKTR